MTKETDKYRYQTIGEPLLSNKWSPETKRFVLAISLVVLAGILYISRAVLPLLLWAMLLAFVLHPLVTLLTRFYIPRLLATLIVYTIFLAALVMLPIIVIPILVEQLGMLRIDPQLLAQRFYEWLIFTLNKYMRGEIFHQPYDLSPYVSLWLEWLQSETWWQAIPSIGELVGTLQAALTATLSVILGATTTAGMVVLQFLAGIFAFFLTLLYTFYLLLVAPKLRISIYELFPEPYHPEISRLIDEIALTWRRYLRGQLFLCFVIFFLTWVSLTYIGMPGAFALALTAGVLEIIPNLGPVLATVPAVIVALVQGSTRFHWPHWEFALLTVGLYTVIQQLENNLLVPRIVGSAINVHPFLVLIGIVVGAQVGGVLGALLAAPMLATLRILARYVHARLLDRPPYPDLVPATVVESPPPQTISEGSPPSSQEPPSVTPDLTSETQGIPELEESTAETELLYGASAEDEGAEGGVAVTGE